VKERPQRTLAKEVELSGTGLHTGLPVRVKLLPADAGAGVVFRRVDLPGRPEVPARIDFADARPRCTFLKHGTAEVSTIEHLLAGLAALQVDNAVAEMSGAEVPGMDGSSRAFVEALRAAGTQDLKATCEGFRPEEPVEVHEGEWALVAFPRDEGLRVTYTLGYDRPRVVQQSFTLDVTPESFAAEIAPARTFVTSDEVEKLRASGLGQGATAENTLVIGESAEEDGRALRFPDEYVRHKILDLVGDLALLGRPLHAHVVAHRTGHAANRALVERMALEMHRREELGYVRRGTGFDIREIMRVLPHRYPFLLVDRVVELEGFKRAVGIKNVSANEPFFQGHYPGNPIMPAVLTLEALAQLAGILLLRKLDYSGKVAVFLGMDRVRLRRAVVPGDQLRLIVETLHLGRRGGKVRARATVRDTLVAEAEMKFMLVDSPSNVEDLEL